jgi:hypothetical protein
MTNSLVAASQNATAYSAPIAKTCRFCGKDGLLILPLRTASLPKEAAAPALPSTTSAHIKGIAIKESSYTLRMARTAYLYMLVNRKGNLSWQCYISTPQGYWAQFAADAPPLEAPEFTCEPGTHGINASMVAIHEAADVQTAYLLYTPSPLTVAMLSEAQLKSNAKADELCAKGQMVKFSPKDWVGGSYTQTDCLQAKDLATSVAEFALANSKSPLSSPLGKALANATFPLMASGQEVDTVGAVAAGHLNRLFALTTFIKEKKAVAIAMYDPIGITQELNDFRNDGLNKVDDYLKTADKDKVSNKWKFDSLQAVREVKTAFEKGLARDTQSHHEDSELHIRAMHQPIFPEDSEQMRLYKEGRKKLDVYRAGEQAWRKEFPQKAAAMDTDLVKHQAELPQRLARAEETAKKYWLKKYDPLLDQGAMASFDAAFDAATKAATDLASKRVDDHLAWVLHDKFIQAFDVYDRFDIYNVANKALNTHSGKFFEGQAALCTLGMVGCEKSAAQIDTWLAGSIGDKKNIYMRGLMLNQEAIEKEAKTALAEAGNITAAAAAVAGVDGKLFHKTLKGMFDLFRKADGAWDEYVREHGKDGNRRSKGLDKIGEGAVLFKMSELNRKVFRGGIGQFEKRFVGFVCGIALARIGTLADELVVNELLHGSSPKDPHKPAKTPTHDINNPADVAAAQKAGKEAAAKAQNLQEKMVDTARWRDNQRNKGITFTIEQYMDKPRTSNYHQARIGGMLAVIETIALGWKMHDIYKKSGTAFSASSTEWWEAGASLLALSSITADIGYSLSKSAREAALDNADNVHVRVAGDTVRGGFKMWAGGLGALAGGIGIYLDYQKLENEKNGANRGSQKYLLYAKLFVGTWNTGFGALAAFSYSGPVFKRYLSKVAADAAARRLAAQGALRFAEWLSTRVLLLRFVAWGTGAGLAMTLGEVAYHAGNSVYMFFEPTALEEWMKKSAFRKPALGGIAFRDSESELQDFAKARKMVGL